MPRPAPVMMATRPSNAPMTYPRLVACGFVVPLSSGRRPPGGRVEKLDVGEAVQAPWSVFDADAARLQPAEGQMGLQAHGMAVDLHLPRLDPQPDIGGADRVGRPDRRGQAERRSEEHTSELQSLMRISYAVFCLKKK